MAQVSKQQETYFVIIKYFRTFKKLIIDTVVAAKMAAKYEHLMLPEALSDKATGDIAFTDEAVVQCDVSVVKILFYVLVIYK